MAPRLSTITGVIGRVLIIFGVVVFLFVAYQLWGTSLSESHSQARLYQHFEKLLHHDNAPTTSTTLPGSPTTSTTSPTTVAPAITAPTAGSPVGIIKIPKIGLDKVIIQGTDTDDLQQGPGHYPNTPLPGEAGNVAIAGHRTTYGAPFFDLNELSKGDTIVITTVQGTFNYTVQTSFVVSPNDVAVADPTPKPMLTLTTCNPRFSASTRLVVQASLASPIAPTLPIPTRVKTKATAKGLAGGQGAWQPALWWGLAVLVIGLGGWLVARRLPRRRARWSAYVVTTVASLVVLLFFFVAIGPLLPASF